MNYKRAFRMITISMQYDFRAGGSVLKKYYLLWLIVFCFVCANYSMEMKSILLAKDMNTTIGVFDQWMYVFRGQMPVAASGEKYFLPDATWMILQVLPLYCVLLYPTKDLSKGGVNILTRSNSRFLWWISKYIWIFVMLLCYYTMLFLVCVINVCLQGELIWGNIQAVSEVFGVVTNRSDLLYLWCLAAPLLSAYTHAAIELVLSLVLTPIASLGIVLILHVCAAYWQTAWLIGNISMFLRSGLIYENGINIGHITVICILLIISCFMAGIVLIKRKDII